MADALYDAILGVEPSKTANTSQKAPTTSGANIEIPDSVLDSLRRVESGKDKFALNKESKAMGPYQFIPETVQMLHKQGYKFNPFDETESREMAKTYLKTLSNRAGSLEGGLAAYGGHITKDPNPYVNNVISGKSQTKQEAIVSDDPLYNAILTGKVEEKPTDLTQKTETPKSISGAGKQFGKDVLGSLNEMSWEDFKKKSLIAPAATYTAASIGIPGFTEQDKQEAAKNLKEKGKAVVEGVKTVANMPVEDFSKGVMKVGKELVERPGKAAGEIIKSSIYDPELMFAGEAVNAVGKPFLAVGKKATSAIADVAMQDPAFAARFAELKAKGASTKEQLGQAWERIKDEQAVPAMAGVGAAETQNATILKQAIETASPELKTELMTADPAFINKKALEAHLEADSLPVRVSLTKGQALGDEVLISKERNERGFKEENARRLNEQNKALQESANLMKDRVAPEYFSANYVADAENAIESVSKKAKQFEKDIKTAYQDLEKQGAGKIEVDSKSFSNNAKNVLMEKDDLEFLPSVIAKRLDSYAKGKPMNFNQYENLRTQIARETRKAQRADDGNAVHALTLVRGELEKLPLLNETAEAKVFADKARGLAKQEFDLLDKNKDTYNPLYADVVNGVADTKDFIPKLILRSKNQDFAKTMSFIADDPQTVKSLRSGALDWIIRDSTDTSGNFKAGKFAKHIENLDVNKKLTPLFGDQAEMLRKIARTGQRVEARPTGSFVNESNSTTALGGMAKEYGQSLIENIPYVGAPIRATKEIVGNIKKRKEISESLKPGAGIKLKDIGKK